MKSTALLSHAAVLKAHVAAQISMKMTRVETVLHAPPILAQAVFRPDLKAMWIVRCLAIEDAPLAHALQRVTLFMPLVGTKCWLTKLERGLKMVKATTKRKPAK